MAVLPSDLASLSVEEKLDLISKLWNGIEASAAVPGLSNDQQQELARRRAAGLSEPSATDDWPSVRQKLFRKQ